MPKPSHRDKILSEGLKVVHAQGFGGASVRDIVQAAGVPQGSFTNHFVSKEAFGLEVLELYACSGRELVESTLLNEAMSPLQALGDYIDGNIARLSEHEMKNGCLLGNYGAETTERSEPIRQRLMQIFLDLESAFETCLRSAIIAGELPPDFEVDGLGSFIVGSMQGAIMLSKAERSLRPVQQFKKTLFANVLRADQRTSAGETSSVALSASSSASA
jgi:TetR/AcrR family transcriptional repressor of nem operon